MNVLTLALEAVRPDDGSRVGGKALGCARLIALGLPVPRGFALTTDALERALVAAGLDERRRALYDAFRGAAPEAELQAQAAALQEAVRAAPLPPEVERALADAAAGLTAPFAVRSSATAEDSRASAFAGVYHSELDVARERLGAAARTCWAHAFGYAALTHALRHNVDPESLRLALVVQEMVPASTAGVLFTQEPSGAHPESALVAITRGLGERLMQGEVDGDSVRLPRDGARPADALLGSLWSLINKLERALGHPQDVEWAQTGDRLLFLQTRPITSLEARRGPSIVWTRELTEERFPLPISPLGWSSLQGVLQVNMKTLAERFGLIARRPDDVARTIRHYVYSNEKFFSIPGSLRPNPLAHARFLPTYLREALGFFRHLPFALGRRWGVRWLFYRQIMRAAIFPHAREIRGSWDAHLAGLIAEMDAFNRVEPDTLDDAALLRHRATMEEVARRYMEPDLAIYVVKIACSWMVGKIGEALRGKPDAAFLTDLTSGLVENRTLRMNTELETLFDSFAAEPRLVELLRGEKYDQLLHSLDGAPALELEKFIQLNGHLTTNWDLREPTWGEDPRIILKMMRSYALAERRRRFGEVAAERAARYRAAREAIAPALAEAGWFAQFFDELLQTLHDFMRIDEEHHFYCSRVYRPMRRVYAEIGRRLVERKVLDHAADVYFLELDEAIEALRHPAFSRRWLVEMRRGDFQRSASARPPDRFLDQAPLLSPAAEHQLTDGRAVFRGVGASPGVASGSVRVVEAPEHVAAFQAGEILVTASPNPAWTPVYAVASALVTSTGSILSHGLVSAREYHLPAVIGISDVTKKLTTGQKVTVDGDQGIVSVERA
jgi:pyruvate,water dikinase